MRWLAGAGSLPAARTRAAASARRAFPVRLAARSRARSQDLVSARLGFARRRCACTGSTDCRHAARPQRAAHRARPSAARSRRARALDAGEPVRELAARSPRPCSPTRLPRRQPRLLLRASHDLALPELARLCAPRLRLELAFRGADECLASLAREECDLAGFHVADALPRAAAAAAALGRWLDPRKHQLLHFVAREQGIIVRPGARIRGVHDLARSGVRFINRPPGSGTQEDLDLAIAEAVSVGRADAGFGLRAAAARYALDFVPLATERYYLAASRHSLREPALQVLVGVLRGREFGDCVARFPGYDASPCGRARDAQCCARMARASERPEGLTLCRGRAHPSPDAGSQTPADPRRRCVQALQVAEGAHFGRTCRSYRLRTTRARLVRRGVLRFWLKLGFISFGGPAGQIAIMHQELVERRRWISERRFLHALNYCMVLPGPEAQQLATYIGWLMHRTWGGIVAGALFVLPSLFILIALSWIYMAYGNVPLVAGILYGIKPAVTAIVLAAAYRIGSRALKNAVLWAIAAAAFIAIFAFDVPFPCDRLGAALLGCIGGRFAPRQVRDGRRARRGRAQAYGRGAHRRRHADARARALHWARLGRTCASSASRSGAVAIGALALASTAGHATLIADGLVLHQGGAAHLRRRLRGAAVRLPGRRRALPLAHRAADDRRPRARRDDAGAAHHGGRIRRLRRRRGRRSSSGPMRCLLAGDRRRRWWRRSSRSCRRSSSSSSARRSSKRRTANLKFTAPLTGITAAVVGVILNLAVFFAYHVLWPQGFGGRVRVVLGADRRRGAHRAVALQGGRSSR